MPQKRATKDFFELLQTFSNELLVVSNNLESDEELIQFLEKVASDPKTDQRIIIRACVLFDLSQISRTLVGTNTKEVAISGLGYTAGRLQRTSEFMNALDHDRFQAMHENGSWKEAADSILNVSNPISLTVKEGDDDAESRNSAFSLPAVLLYSGNALFEKYAVALCRFSTVIAKADGVISTEEETLLKQIYENAHNPIPEIANKHLKITLDSENQSLNDILTELDLLVGLNTVKQEVKTLINFAKVQTEREKLGLKSPGISYHLVLTGSPGTGKTTVARIVSKIYNKLGILAKGQLVETDRSGLIAEYTGQTSIKVNKAVDSALDGVLFIDEAYSLVDDSKHSYGSEAIAALLKRMEDDRERLVVMVAGYTTEMNAFINANSGFKSRFNKYIEFPDYTPEEMLEIFDRLCIGLDYTITEEARTKVRELFILAYGQRDKSFGNGRFVRNIFEKSMELQANRVAGIFPLTKEILTAISADDIPKK